MENNFDNGLFIYLTFGEIWTVHIFSGYITYQDQEQSAVEEETAKINTDQQYWMWAQNKTPGCEPFSQIL